MPRGARALHKAASTRSATEYAGDLVRCYNAISYHKHTNAIVDKIPFHEDQKDEFVAHGKAARRGPDAKSSQLSGVVVAVKDNIQTADLFTTCASNILHGFQSSSDATVVRKLRKAGSLIFAKTNMDEFGMGSHSTHSAFGPVKNGSKADGELSAGGSSGGSAIAVALRQCDVALGTDTGGSVRLPAAYTGIFGFKPSYGLLSRNGVVPYANSLDTVGILADKLSLVVKTFNALNGYDEADPTSLSQKSRSRCVRTETPRWSVSPTHDKPLDTLRIGVPVEYIVRELQDAVHEAWLYSLSVLEALGCEVVPISLPSTKQALSAYYVLAPAEASSNLAKYDGVRYGMRNEFDADKSGNPLYAGLRGSKFGDEVKRRILLGAYSLSADAIGNYFIKAQKVRRIVQRDFDLVFKLKNPLHNRAKANSNGVDAILCPTAPTTPPLLSALENQTPLDAYVNDVFTVPASLAGLPSISIPARVPPKSKHEKPPFIGMQIIGQYGDDATVLALAGILTKSKYWLPSRPDVIRDHNVRQIG